MQIMSNQAGSNTAPDRWFAAVTVAVIVAPVVVWLVWPERAFTKDVYAVLQLEGSGVAFAFRDYHEDHDQTLLPVNVDPETGAKSAWNAHLLRQMDVPAVYRYDASAPWNSPQNLPLHQPMLRLLETGASHRQNLKPTFRFVGIADGTDWWLPRGLVPAEKGEPRVMVIALPASLLADEGLEATVLQVDDLKPLVGELRREYGDDAATLAVLNGEHTPWMWVRFDRLALAVKQTGSG
jgi:hypothetical protein